MDNVLAIPAFRDNYIWLIHDDAHEQAVVVDPGEADPVFDTLEREELTLVGILITHHHPDHVGGVNALLAEYDVPVWGPARERIPGRTVALADGDRVAIEPLGLAFDVIDVPGHTAGHIAYHGHGMLFCGDTLFVGGCGRLFEGTPAQMLESLSRLRDLPGETRVYCAHEYTLANLRFALAVEPDNTALQQRMREVEQLREACRPTVPSTLASERAVNPFLRFDAPSVKASAERHAGKALESTVDVFAAVRGWKDRF